MVENLLREINERYEREFRKFFNKLIDLYPNTTVILFGSRASGKNRPNSDFDIIVFIECENPLHKSIEIYSRTMPNVPVDIIVMKTEECNENNVNLSHMLYYGYKILYDNLELKDKIYNMIIKNKDKLKDILPYDNIKSGHKKNSFL